MWREFDPDRATFLETPLKRASCLVAIVALLVSACDGSKEPPKKEPAAAAKTDASARVESADSSGALLDLAKGPAKDLAKAAEVPTEVEVGCAMCIYQMAGVTTCRPAVKLAGTVYLLEGLESSAHEFCDGAKKATVQGRIEGTRFVATKVEIVK